MYETTSELKAMQHLLDRSSARAGAHLRSIFGDDKRLSARQIARYLQGVKVVAAAAVSAKGEPMVAPIDAVLFHGKFHLSTDATSLRARRLLRNPAIGVTYFESGDPMIIVNGRAAIIRTGDPSFAHLDSIWEKEYGKSLLEFAETGLFIRVEPTRMLAYAMHPRRFGSP